MTRRWVVRGRVQGVGYRAFVVHEAGRLGLGGFARNLPDGAVEVVAAGDAAALDALAARLRTGPLLARVDSVEAADAVDQAFSGFGVRP